MGQTVLDLVCPGCGAPVESRMEECPYCGRPVVITSVADAAQFTRPQLTEAIKQFRRCIELDADNKADYELALGCCFLSLGLYPKALGSFEAAIAENPLDARAYFNAAVSILGGKTPFAVKRAGIDVVVDYLDSAIQIGDEALHHALLAFVLYDFFVRKSLKTNRDWAAELARARELGFTPADGDALFALLCIRPTSFFRG